MGCLWANIINYNDSFEFIYLFPMKNSNRVSDETMRRNDFLSLVKRELDIDLDDFLSHDLLQQIQSLITIQASLWTSFILPFLFLLTLFLSIFIFIDFYWVTGILVFFLGSIWLLLFTFTIGIQRYFRNFRKNLILLVDFISDLLNKFNLNILNNPRFVDNKSEKVYLLIHGLLFSILIPSINEAIQKKVPFLKNYFQLLIEKVAQLIFDSLKKPINESKIIDNASQRLESSTKSISNELSDRLIGIKNSATSIVNNAMKVVVYPIATANVIQALLIIICVYLLSF